MILALSLIAFWLIVIFGFVILVGPPYLPTTRKQIGAALDLLDLQEGETLLELGSGDGRVVRAAAKRGLKVVGIELNPLLVIISMMATIKYRKQVRIIWGSYWGAPWPRADAIFTFMLPRYMPRLHKRIEQWHTKSVRLASFAFKIPDKELISTKAGVYLYEYK